MSLAGIDVVIPCYNYGRFLNDSVSSVLRVSRLPVRVLIIDDASTDGSAIQARKIADTDSRVQVIEHRLNRGHIATYNEGIEWAKAAYMLLLSADDIVAPGALERAVTLMEHNPQIAFVYGGFIKFSGVDKLQVSYGDLTPEAKIWNGLDFVRHICAHPSNPVETATAVVRTTVQKHVGGYRPEFPHAGDLEMWLRCASHGDVGVIDAVQAFVRLHEKNMRKTYTGATDYKQRYQTFDHFLCSHAAIIGDAERLRRQAFRGLADEVLWGASQAIDEGRPSGWMVRLAREFWPGIWRTLPYWKVAIKSASRSGKKLLRSATGSSEAPGAGW
jgi:glycosyltransferase involved in cell wall biosynthesis